MSRDGRKPWEIPISYNEDRFVEPTKESVAINPRHDGGGWDSGDVRGADEIEELLRRPDRTEDDRVYECNDKTPVNYMNGPHDEEFGVEDNDFDEGAENPPLNYERGPHDEAFGVDDDELEDLDGSSEFDEEV